MTDVEPFLDTMAGDEAGDEVSDERPHLTREPTGADFERRRVVSAVRARLFGGEAELHIGRYRIEGRLGAGGMGEVYLGHDPELGRKVAIKRVRGRQASRAQRERLREEARVLAKLSDPHVVVVHEVGEHEGELYVAMEYVEGETLTSWLETPRTWRAILAQFVAAGRGLAVAHSAGVVHRDFKPENVLVGVDGRVRVADFGLALVDEGELRSTDAASSLAQEGAAGTLRYMPHEQLRGDMVDARSDQFAFCVALYEALYAQPPFAPGDLPARLAALQTDAPARPPRRGPRRLWTIVRRGLRLEPSQRWPDLDALLAALESVVARRRRAALVVTGVALAGLGLLARVTPEPCGSVDAELAGVWDESVAAEVEAAFAASELEHAPRSLARVQVGLDAWTRAWLTQRRQQCEAARASADPPELIRARRGCLERQRRGVAVLTETLREADAAVIDRAGDAIEGLTDPEACAPAQLLEQSALEPVDPSDHAQADALRVELAELGVQRQLGRADAERAQAALDSALALGFAPIVAEARAERGLGEFETGSAVAAFELLVEAGNDALAASHSHLMAEIWLRLAMHSLTDLPDASEASRYLGQAEALAPILHDVGLSEELAFAHAKLEQTRGELDGASAALRTLLGDLGDEPHRLRAPCLASLAEIGHERRDHEAELDLRREALTAAEVFWGRDHPNVARHVFNLGLAHDERGELEQANAALDRYVAMSTATHREPHPELGDAYLAKAYLTWRAGDLAGAEVLARAAAATFAATLPSDHEQHGSANMLLSRLAGAQGDRARALIYARRALRDWATGRRADDPDVLEVRLDIAMHELGLGDFDAAEEDLRALLSEVVDAGVRARIWLNLCELALRRGDLARARQAMEQVQADVLRELDPADGLSREVLDATIELRAGCSSCDAEARAAIARERDALGLPDDVLGAWVGELGLTADEARRLGLPAPP